MNDQPTDNPNPQPPDDPEALIISPSVWVASSDLQFRFSRSSGPGGQSVNKVATKAELRVTVEMIHGLDDEARGRLRRMAGQRLTQGDEILITSDRHRSQSANRRDCLARLAELIERAARKPRRRRRRGPTRAMIERRLNQKRQRSEKKQRRRWKPE